MCLYVEIVQVYVSADSSADGHDGDVALSANRHAKAEKHS